MTASIADQLAVSTTDPRPPVRPRRREVTRTVRGTRMHLVLVPPAQDGGQPVITFDQHADVLAKGYLTLAEAGAISAALDALRARAVQ